LSGLLEGRVGRTGIHDFDGRLRRDEDVGRPSPDTSRNAALAASLDRVLIADALGRAGGSKYEGIAGVCLGDSNAAGYGLGEGWEERSSTLSWVGCLHGAPARACRSPTALSCMSRWVSP